MSVACPDCGSRRSIVTDSRMRSEGGILGHGVRRRRRCKGCDTRFSTYEIERARISTIARLFDHLDLVDRMLARIRGEMSTAQETLEPEDEDPGA